jgi:hypothetical protein
MGLFIFGLQTLLVAIGPGRGFGEIVAIPRAAPYTL